MTSEPDEINELAALKALAHPRRQAIMRYLTAHGPATSAALARELGLNTGATSYHLRELAAHDFVVELPEQAKGRERWWKAVPRDLRFAAAREQSDTARRLVDAIGRDSFTADLEQFARSQSAAPREGWPDTLPYSRGARSLTPDELHEFFEAYIALMNRYRRPGEPAPDGARTVQLRFLAFPEPDPTTGDDPVE